MSFDVSSSSSPSQMVWVHPNKLHILNATQSKTRSLPSELLSLIFQHACPTPDIFDEEHTQMPTPFHLILRLVSTLWYDISQSTPQLWASVFLPKLYVEDIDIRAQYLKLCLNNSGDLPLTLSLRFDPKIRETGWFVSPIVDATLEHSTHRIRALRLLLPPHSWLDILIPKMYQLAMLHIFLPDSFSSPHNCDALFLPKTANISRIQIRFGRLRDFHLDCATPSLTHVDLDEWPIDFVIEFLLRCPNLIDFRSQYPLPPSKVKDPRSMLASPLVLSHISTFTWYASQVFLCDPEWDTVLYEHIRFPNLTRFNWKSDRLPFMINNALPLPLFNFPKSVTTLELDSVEFNTTEETLNHFLPLTGVTQLWLTRCDDDFVEQAFFVLSRRTDQRNTLFPKLTSIVLNYQVVKGRTPPTAKFRLESVKKLVQMLQSRIGLIEHFTLVVKVVSVARCWDDSIRRALRKIKRDGLSLTIIEHKHPIVF